MANNKSGGIGAWGLLGILVACVYLFSGARKDTAPTVAAALLVAPPTAAELESRALVAKKDDRINKVAVFVRTVRESMRDPDSFKLSSVGANDDASVMCMEYRGKNGFGGYSVERVSYASGKVAQSNAQWNKHCAHKDLIDMGQVEYVL